MRSIVLLSAAALAACDTLSRDAALRDNTTAVPDSAAGTVALDTGAAHYTAYPRDSSNGRILWETSSSAWSARFSAAGCLAHSVSHCPSAA